jgi:DNA-binding CsgD family transcriptional regulator
MNSTCPSCGTVLDPCPECGHDQGATLSPQQQRTVEIFCTQDVTIPEAARLLGVQTGTMKSLLLVIYQKLGVKSRSGMVAEAFRRGIVKVGP